MGGRFNVLKTHFFLMLNTEEAINTVFNFYHEAIQESKNG
jgi:hypothetical protein